MTAFFVPGVEPDRAEARWLELAEFAEAPVVGPADRVASVRFVSGAEEWTATVGEHLSGQLTAGSGRRRSASAPTRRVSDPATVLAIVDTNDAYRVLTDGPPLGGVDDSTWDNPVTVPRRDARAVRRFGE